MSSVCEKLSVVVIGRNEGERLRRCLESVQKMRRGSFELELIYVDSGSTDASVAIAEGFEAKVIALKPERPTAALGRNAGWRASTGEIVLFLDGDTVLEESFVVKALPGFEDATVGCIWGHRREMEPTQSWYVRVLDLDWIYAPGWAQFCGGDALFRRGVLESAGGFDETLIAGEEPELCRRISRDGYRILHLDLAMTKHDLAMTHFRQYWQRATRAGHAYAEVAARYARSKNPIWSGEVRRNRVRVAQLFLLMMLGPAVSVELHSAWPMVAVLLLLFVLVVRTAWKARWKSADKWTLLLYGVHSHLQQFPIFWGQVRFAWNRRRGARAGLVEYKGA